MKLYSLTRRQNSPPQISCSESILQHTMSGIGYIVMVSRIAAGYSILKQKMFIEFVIF
jgi:hypothetical protein